MPTDVDWAYAAGIMDGEGTFVIAHNCGNIQLYLRVLMSREAVVAWLFSTFGGKVFKNEDRLGPTYMWHLSSSNCVPFIAGIQPYLKLKQPQAELALKFCETLAPRNLGIKTEDRTQLMRLKLRELMQLCNAKRKPTAEIPIMEEEECLQS